VRRREEPGADAALLADLGSELALVAVPPGSGLGRRRLSVQVDDLVAVELADEAGQGLRLRRVPAGAHRVVLVWGGQRRELRLELPGGEVTTVGLVNTGAGWRGGFRVEPLDPPLPPRDWEQRFGGLRLREAFWPQDEGAVEPQALPP
jgi:hypothetical protein